MSIDVWLLPWLLGILVLYLWVQKETLRHSKSEMKYSAAAPFFTLPESFKTRFSFIPKLLLYSGLLMLALAFLDPHTFIPREGKKGGIAPDPKEGRILLFAADQSGSMRESAEGRLSKLDMMKQEMAWLINKREGDLIGLMSFARTAVILAPPTLDHEAVLKALNQINPAPSPEWDGTSIGYVIFKGATLIAGLKEQSLALGKEAPYDVHGSALIVITDGLQDPNPLDKGNRFRSMEVEQAARYAKEKGVKVYIVNIEPKLASSKYLPNLKEMKRAAEITGGELYFSGTEGSLESFLERIDALETSTLYAGKDKKDFPTLFKRVSSAQEFLLAAFIFLFIGFILSETYFKKVTG
jgi:Ca-activated chloride channel family protein